MTRPAVGAAAPDFRLPATDGQTLGLADFRGEHELGFDLIADTDEVACNAFDVLREKNMFGRKVRGIERSTFLIDADGVLQQEWRGVKVPGHVDEVLAAARAL